MLAGFRNVQAMQKKRKYLVLIHAGGVPNVRNLCYVVKLVDRLIKTCRVLINQLNCHCAIHPFRIE